MNLRLAVIVRSPRPLRRRCCDSRDGAVLKRIFQPCSFKRAFNAHQHDGHADRQGSAFDCVHTLASAAPSRGGQIPAPLTGTTLHASLEEAAQTALDAADRIIAVLDRMDGDADEDGGEGESSLAAPENTAGSQVVYMRGDDQDCETEAPETVLSEVAVEPAPASIVIPWRGRGNIIAAAGVAPWTSWAWADADSYPNAIAHTTAIERLSWVDTARFMILLQRVRWLNAAHENALSQARIMIARERHTFIRDWMVCAFEIMDEAGQPVLTVPFSDTVPASNLD